MGQKPEALKYYQEALSIRREVGDRGGEGTTLNNLGGVYDALGQKSEALKYFQEALSIYREVGARGGEGVTLWNIGTFYFEQSNYQAALACFLLARSIFDEVQSPDRDVVQGWIDDLYVEVGDEQFATLVAQVEPQASQIVEKALKEGL